MKKYIAIFLMIGALNLKGADELDSYSPDMKQLMEQVRSNPDCLKNWNHEQLFKLKFSYEKRILEIEQERFKEQLILRTECSNSKHAGLMTPATIINGEFICLSKFSTYSQAGGMIELYYCAGCKKSNFDLISNRILKIENYIKPINQALETIEAEQHFKEDFSESFQQLFEITKQK